MKPEIDCPHRGWRRLHQATRTALLFCGTLALSAMAGEAFPNLPPAAEVARILADAPALRAAIASREAEEANRTRLEAGTYEWNVRAGGQQRRTYPSGQPNERYTEWSAALERPLRLPGKAGVDAEIGAAGVALADTAVGDARHELSRLLLKSWFDWLRESAARSQWQAQVALLDRQTQAVRRRQQLGDASRLEAIQAEAALAQAQAQLAQAGSREQSAAATLRQRFPGLTLDAPGRLAEPPALEGDAALWIDAVLAHSHELGLAEKERQRAGLQADRARRDRLPDPTVGIAWSRERAGEENIVGAYISIPLPGSARSAAADAAGAQHNAAQFREAATRQRIAGEAAALFQAAQAALPAWQAARSAAARLGESADLAARAYQLGEGSLPELLAARRLANDAELAARTQQLDTLELRYRLLLDTHRLWDMD